MSAYFSYLSHSLQVQFKLIQEKELLRIVKAFKKFDEPGKLYKPKLTIVICGKRHHTILPHQCRPCYERRKSAPWNGGQSLRNGSIQLLPSSFNVRFVSLYVSVTDPRGEAHGNLQGTAQPTHFYVVHDEIGFDADGL